MKQPFLKNEKRFVLVLLLFFLVAAVVVIFNTVNSFGGGDPFAHFKIAYWSWKYPRLFFDEWGKPVYTILVSPFAQMGMNFARLYNVLMGLLAAFFAWKLSRVLKLNNAWLVVLLVLFTPIYFSLMFAALTEVTFSMLLVLSLLLFFQKKYGWSAVVFSFLPLVRTESVVLLPLFLLAFGMKKQWKVMPLFATGFLSITLLGLPFYQNFWWLITQMPYKGGASDIYGHGTLFHFIYETRGILGYPLAFLFCVGLIMNIWSWIKKDKFRSDQRFYFLLLVPGTYLLFFAAHSYVWWQGIGNSLGLIRVIGAVTPLAAITALSGFNILVDTFSKYRKLVFVFSLMLFLWVFIAGSTTRLAGFKVSEEQHELTEACNFIKQHKLTSHKIYFFTNFVTYQLGLDPYDSQHATEGVPHISKISNGIPEGSIIVWDAHFGPNEGKTPLDKLLSDNGLEVLKIIQSERSSGIAGSHNYAVCIFQKKKSNPGKIRNMLFDFENVQDEKGNHYSRKYAHTGSYSLKMDSMIQFSPTFVISSKTLLRNHYKWLRVSVWVYPIHPLTETPCSLVVSFQQGNTAIKYRSLDLNNSLNARKLKLNHWNKITMDYLLPDIRQKTDNLKIYIWNQGKKVIYFDDLKVEMFSKLGKSINLR